MTKKLLETKNLRVAHKNQEILKDISLTISTGEIHFLTGANGIGKSTLAGVLMGPLEPQKLSGEVKFLGLDLLGLAPAERARRGLFLGFQEVPEIPGVSVFDLVEASLKAQNKPKKLSDLYHEMNIFLKLLNLSENFAEREIVGLSGGEKRKLELLQLLILKPRLAILDEADAGLDKMSLKELPDILKKYHCENNSLLIITHNASLPEKFPHAILHEMKDGRLV